MSWIVQISKAYIIFVKHGFEVQSVFDLSRRQKLQTFDPAVNFIQRPNKSRLMFFNVLLILFQ